MQMPLETRKNLPHFFELPISKDIPGNSTNLGTERLRVALGYKPLGNYTIATIYTLFIRGLVKGSLEEPQQP